MIFTGTTLCPDPADRFWITADGTSFATGFPARVEAIYAAARYRGPGTPGGGRRGGAYWVSGIMAPAERDARSPRSSALGGHCW